ncbi:MAG: nucleoside-diphosphate kinase [Candidatus Infernicultor aquiphilus]|uniref:nucleoside-diphosphate kinase n=2 Tax=Candidatus Infernicultor aquiphilus TaxID=1805029 RepID=A0A2M7PP13_9BACT|nr:MAG: nucleoside-diphosphate kinase [Candidatus Atribacteria bacterium CG_4_10_14_3_um_filter_34_13]
MERTLVLIKPDAFKRGLVGEIISRFERVGLTLEGMKILNATIEMVEKHYPDDKNWIRSVGKKTIDTYEKYNLNIIEDLGTNDALKIGQLVRKWLIQHLTSGPVLVLILSGNHAVEMVRKIVGNTVPLFAELGTIRGDFSIDSPDLSAREKRVLQNLVHASETVEEAKREISLWFANYS